MVRMERKGKEGENRKRLERKGKERKGKERKERYGGMIREER